MFDKIIILYISYFGNECGFKLGLWKVFSVSRTKKSDFADP
jgi:hypothetical protein